MKPKPTCDKPKARERSEQHMTRSVFVSEWTHPKALSVFNPECMIAWSTMGPTSKQNEWTMEFWTPWKDTSGPTGWKGRERIYTPEQIPLDPHALQIFVQLKRIKSKVLVHCQLVWHCSWSPPRSMYLLCSSCWPSYMFICTWNKQCYVQ